MKYEQLKPNLLIPQLEERLLELKETLKKVNNDNSKIPQDNFNLRIAQRKGHPQYYCVNKSTYPTGKYIPHKQKAFAQRLAQKDYYQQLVQLLKHEIQATEQFLLQITATNCKQNLRKSQTAIEALYTKMCPARQKLITPVTLTSEQYAIQWLNVTWQGLPFLPDAPVHTTIKQERVRSKSEVLIADALTRHGIPYRYEYPLIIKKNNKSGIRPSTGSGTTNSITLHPDFLCLNVRTRQEFYWEHFGLMDLSDYAKNAAGKLRLYTENGIFPGHNIIITMETQSEPLSTQTIELTIKEYLT